MSAISSTLPSIISMADMATSLSELHQTHAQMLKTGLMHSTFAVSRLITSIVTASSSAASSLAYADSLFARIPTPNSYTWNTLIRAHATSSNPEKALVFFHRMLHSPVLPDKFTFSFVLKACSSLPALEEAHQIHARILKSGFLMFSDVFVQNTLIHVYASSGCNQEALKVFDRMPTRDVISCNALISAYAAQGLMGPARELFDEMEDRNVETWNFMVSGYVNVGSLDDAWGLFNKMSIRDAISWNAMITACANAGRFDNALAFFRDMQKANVHPNNRTFVSVLSVCAQLGALVQGEWVHAYIDKHGVEVEGFLASALVDMYSKCGNLEKALEVFNNTSNKDISTWNSMITGLSSHCRGLDALSLFEEMLQHRLAPNEITFIIVLCACSHSGLLGEGQRIFKHMVEGHHIEPKIEHYGCIVDLLGRSGQLKEAEEFISSNSSLTQAPVLWESLLSASRSHGNLELAEIAAKHIAELSPRDSSCYVQLSNLYASKGRWIDVWRVRESMRANRIRKEPGLSTIEVDGVLHEFFVGD